MINLITKALLASRESKDIEFKSEFDVSSTQDWCEIIKDIIAIANSGGGIIIFGLNDIGEPVGYDASTLLSYDSADITNKISKYIGQQFFEFYIDTANKGGHQLALMVIESSTIPLVFMKPGTYNSGDNLQKTAFKEGAVYFRHGAKSEPGRTEDLHRAFQKELNRVKKSWLNDIGKIIKAPSDSDLIYVPKSQHSTQNAVATAVRITDDPNALVYGKINYDETHPHLQKDVLSSVNSNLPDDVSINTYDVLALRNVLSANLYNKFCHKPKFGSTQYSSDFINWIVHEFNRDHDFFINVRQQYKNVK